MSNLGNHIENAIRAGRVKNAEQIARQMNVAPATVSRWKAGKRVPSPEEARLLAQILGAPAEMLMAEVEAGRTKDPATRAAWLRVARWCARQTSTTATLAALAFVTLFLSAPQNAVAKTETYSAAVAGNTHYGVYAIISVVVPFD